MLSTSHGGLRFHHLECLLCAHERAARATHTCTVNMRSFDQFVLYAHVCLRQVCVDNALPLIKREVFEQVPTDPKACVVEQDIEPTEGILDSSKHCLH